MEILSITRSMLIAAINKLLDSLYIAAIFYVETSF